MEILILGGTGAMGKALVDELGNRGDTLYITSRRSIRSENSNVNYIQGNAHDLNFIQVLLNRHYDAIVDFMVYHTKEFEERMHLFLASTNQYMYLSSCRVYAQSEEPLLENSDRLYDVCKDSDYLATDEYALTKAKQENMLIKSSKNNWTIIRPYITYSNERMQLGVFEKEEWLYRALKGKPIVFTSDIATKSTTLTSGKDVAKAMACLIGNKKAYGEIYHITGNQSMTWADILKIYSSAIEKVTGKRPEICMLFNAVDTRAIGSLAQLKYDRLYNRVFDNSKIVNATDGKIAFESMEEGLTKAVTEFIDGQHTFKQIIWKYEARKDRLSGYKTPLSEIPGRKNKFNYIVHRYIPIVGRYIEMVKDSDNSRRLKS